MIQNLKILARVYGSHADLCRIWYNNTPNAGIVLANTLLQASIGNCKNLKYLCTYNSTRHGGLAGQMVDLSQCEKLERLKSRGNSCGYKLGPSVKSAMLDMDGTRGFDCSKASSIQKIEITWASLDNASLKTLCEGLKNNKTLRTLNIRANNLTDISPLSLLKNTGITYLRASRNGYSGFYSIDSLRELTTLEHIDIAGQYISDLSPIENLVDLKYLDVSDNKISDISCLNNMPLLEEIYLQGNSINNIYSLIGKNNLKVLNLENNSLTDMFYESGSVYYTSDILYDLNIGKNGLLTKLYLLGNNLSETDVLLDLEWEERSGF